MMRLLPLFLRAGLVVTLVMSGWAQGQATAQSTTQPAAAAPTAPVIPEGPSWNKLVAQLADQLAGKDVASLRVAIGPEAIIRNFASDNPTTPERLLASTSQAKLIGTHAYPRLPLSMATDLANDFRGAAEVVPETVQKDMVPTDPALEKKANETAAAWLAQVLQPTQNRTVGVIVFWPMERRGPSETSSRRAIFVVVKAQLMNGAYVVQQVRFGDPLEPPR